MNSIYVHGIPSKTEIYKLIDDNKYQEALELSYERYNATGLLYELPPIIALRKKIYGNDDSESYKLKNKLLRDGNYDDISKLGNTLKILGLYEEGLEVYSSLLETYRFNDAFPQILEIYHLLGRENEAAEFKKKWVYDKEESKNELDSIIKNRSNDNVEETTRRLEKLVEDNPTYEQAKYELGRSYMFMKEYEKSKKIFQELIDNNKNTLKEYSYMYNFALCMYLEGYPEKADAYLKIIPIQLIENLDTKIKILLLLVSINEALNRPFIEIPYLEELCKINPSADYYFKLSNLYKKVKDLDKTIDCLYMADFYEEDEFKKTDILHQILMVKLKQHKYEEALKYYYQVVKNEKYCLAYAKELTNTMAFINKKLGKEIKEDYYLTSQLKEYSKPHAISHIRLHLKDVNNDIENKTMFDDDVDIEKLYDEVYEIISKRSEDTFDLCDIYIVKLPYVVLTHEEYPVQTIRVVTIMDTKDIITMYPLLPTEEEKRRYESEKKQNNESTKLSAMEKFNLKYGKR